MAFLNSFALACLLVGLPLSALAYDTTVGNSAKAPGNYFDVQANDTNPAPGGTFGCAANSGGGWRITDVYQDTTGKRRWEECDGTRVMTVPSLSAFHVGFVFQSIALNSLKSGCLRRWPGTTTAVTNCAAGNALTNLDKLGIMLARASANAHQPPYIRHLACTISSITGANSDDAIAFEVVQFSGTSTRNVIGSVMTMDYSKITSNEPPQEIEIDTYGVYSDGGIGVRVNLANTKDTDASVTSISGACELYGYI